MKDMYEVIDRMLEYNAIEGKTITALLKVFETTWSVGTNIVTEWIKLMAGLLYGDSGYKLDKSADCSQFWIDLLYFWFGITGLGSYTESLWAAGSKRGTRYKTIAEAPLLSVILYKLSSRNPHATHAAGKVSATQIADTRSKQKPLMIRNFRGWYENRITLIVNLLTAEQLASVTVSESDFAAKPPVTFNRTIQLQYSATSTTYIRKGTGLRFSAICKIAKSTKVTYLCTMGNWYKVIYNGITGYVKSSSLSRCKLMTGDDVKTIQKKLQAAGFTTGPINGICGPVTAAAISAYKASKGLPVNGVVDNNTWALIVG